MWEGRSGGVGCGGGGPPAVSIVWGPQRPTGPILLPTRLPKMTIWCDVEILEHIGDKEIFKHARIGLQILKVQTLKHRSTMEKFLESILCPRNKQSKVAQVTHLSHTPRILLRALKYYATRPLPEGPKGGASRHFPNPSPICSPRPLFAHSPIPLPTLLPTCPPCCPLAYPK